MTRPTIVSRSNPQRHSVRRGSTTAGPRFVLGLDLGQTRDYTAMAILERVVMDQINDLASEPQYHLRYLERYRLGTPYPEIVEDIAEFLDRRPLAGCTKLVLDGTGVGVPVVEMFRARGLHPLPVWITGGDRVTRAGQIVRVPKRDLVGALQVVFQTRRLRIAPGLAERDALIAELMSFRAKITTRGHDTYASWRDGDHDDLVLALALGSWYFERIRLNRHSSVNLNVSGLNAVQDC